MSEEESDGIQAVWNYRAEKRRERERIEWEEDQRKAADSKSAGQVKE